MTVTQEKVYVPPIKIQGIKTKLVPLIKESVDIDPTTVWVEPFLGSGVVGFNVAPQSAIFADTNPYIIAFYQQIQSGAITADLVRDHLTQEGALLAERDDQYYYEVRDRFNEQHHPLDFLFLNRSCFNGMIRFNRNHCFNVPYCHKPQRFSKSYVTKITNQVKHLEELMAGKAWTFLCQSFEDTISAVTEDAFIYCDPPYIGRHVDYYDSWDVDAETALRDVLVGTRAKFMLSTWDRTQYRENRYTRTLWSFCRQRTKEHFYHVGAHESNRQAIVEALLMNYRAPDEHPRRILTP